MKPNLIVIPERKICDYIDGKFRNDTPEEYVRQNIEKRLVNEHKYKKERIAVEFTITVGSMEYRLSTHPDFITYEKDKLKYHPEPKISLLFA